MFKIDLSEHGLFTLLLILAQRGGGARREGRWEEGKGRDGEARAGGYYNYKEVGRWRCCLLADQPCRALLSPVEDVGDCSTFYRDGFASVTFVELDACAFVCVSGVS